MPADEVRGENWKLNGAVAVAIHACGVPSFMPKNSILWLHDCIVRVALTDCPIPIMWGIAHASPTLMVDVATRVGLKVDVAVMVAVPSATPVTRPPASTVATEASLLDQVTPDGTPGSADTVATSWRWNAVPSPVPTRTESLVGEMVTPVTSMTCTEALSPMPGFATASARITDVPRDMAVSSPVGDTVATPGLSLSHLIGAPLAQPSVRAVSWRVVAGNMGPRGTG